LATLTISGSGSTTTVLEAVKAAFEADTPGYQIEVLSGTGTGGGVQGVVDSTLDAAAMARAPKDDEAIEYAEFGRSGQALYVNEGVGDIDLTSQQASSIVFGEITNWSEVGGPDMEIVLYVRDESDSSTTELREALFGDEPFAETAQVMTSQGDMLNAVERIEGAIGFGSWPAALAVGAKVKPVSLDGVKPADSQYPITTALGIGFLAERQTDVQPLIDWLLSDAGKTALREIGVTVE
jgi:phosphate transport system substrate-binding protein